MKKTSRKAADRRGKESRPGWDEYFMGFAQLASRRSTCLRRKVGAVVARDRRVLATGYNGAPSGLSHCGEVGCLRVKLQVPSGERHELCRGLHAEQNAIIQAANYGISIRGGILYTTLFPCSICTKMLINAGIENLVYQEGYPDPLAQELLRGSKIKVKKFQKASGKK
ncbi:MAG: cytidine/deoxycytidylate deaminase family protein [bacterium]|nr:cytidine/deoxycytidylate deaminase family protein [bacterium]